MPSAAKAKGNSWEREVAKILTETFGYHFERGKTSGAFIGAKNAYRKEYLSETQIVSAMADIIPPTEMRNCVVECKFYKEFPFHHLLIDKDIPILNSWIDQQLDIIDEKHFWFIAFKINHCGQFIVISKKLVPFIDKKLKNHSIYFYKNEEYIITELDKFLKDYNLEIKELCK